MTLTPENKQKLLEIENRLHMPKGKFTYDELEDLIGREHAETIFRKGDSIKSPKALARVIRRFVRTGVLEFKKSEVRE